MKSLFILCIIMGVASLLYYVLCIVYTGAAASFSFIWLVFSGILFCSSGAIWYVQKQQIEIPVLVQMSILVVVGWFLLVFIIAEGVIFYYGKQSAPVGAEYMIVLGAKVNGQVVSGSLQKRLDTAICYLRKNPNTKVIVSGGKGNDEEITEALAMERYLLGKGVVKNQIQKEEQATNTIENILYSRKFIGDDNKPVVIVTNRFHIYRSLCMARKQGMTSVYGLSAPTDPVMALTYYVREGFAVMKYKATKQI